MARARQDSVDRHVARWSGLLARAVVVIDADGVVTHTQVVPTIGQEPDYDAVVASLG